MKIINIKNYTGFDIFSKKEAPYDVKASIKMILFNPQLQLNDVELINNFEIWNKIKDEEEEIILENADYDKLKNCLKRIRGFVENDIEFVNRILEAKDYEIKVKK